MSATIVIGRELSSLSEQLKSLQTQLNNSKNSINSYANSANNATSKSQYDSFVNKYNTERNSFNSMLSSYEDLGGQYSAKLERYDTLEFANQVESMNYETPNPKDNFEWLAGGTFYNEKQPGGYIWSPTNPLSADEKPKQDLGFVLKTGAIHPYLNEGWTEIQNTLKGFGFLDILGEPTSKNVYEVTVTVTQKDGSIWEETKYINSDSDSDSSINGFSHTQNNMGVDAIASILTASGMDLMSLNAMGVIEFLVTNTINGNMFKSGKIQIGEMIGASLYNTVKNTLAQKLTMGLVKAFGISNVYAAGILSIGVGSLVSEFMEVYVLGIDNHFGFGGDVMHDALGNVKKSDGGNTEFEMKSSLSQKLRSGAIEAFGFDFVSNFTDITDKDRYRAWEKNGFNITDMQNAMEQADSSNDNNWDIDNDFTDLDFRDDDFNADGSIRTATNDDRNDNDNNGDGTDTVGSGAGSFGPGGEDGSGGI
jgi:hypothetical protein